MRGTWGTPGFLLELRNLMDTALEHLRIHSGAPEGWGICLQPLVRECEAQRQLKTDN